MGEADAEIGPPRRSMTRALRLGLFAAVGAGLLWAIVTHSLVAALVEIDPKRALLIKPDDPAALLALADRAMDLERAQRAVRAKAGPEAAPPTDIEEEVRREREANLRHWATAVLAQEPGNARALAILGDLARRAGNDDAARTLLGASARRSPHEPIVLAWQIDQALKQQDWPLAVQRIDKMMRYYEQSIGPLSALLAELLLNPQAAPLVRESLAAAPPWRRGFIPTLLTATTDARLPLELFLALKQTPNPPTTGELLAYLHFLIERKFFDLAYYTWLQFLPADQLARVGLLFNGDFEDHPTGLPFDWVLTRESAGSAAIERRADRSNQHALVVRLEEGRAPVNYIRQILRLPPGTYRITGTASGDLQGARGMRWRVRCFGTSPLLGQSSMLGGRMPTWTEFVFQVTVPETGCAAQELSLVLDARSASEQLVSGVISFDELSARREP